MTRPTRPPLDADEQAIAARLPRLPGRTEPGPSLDAGILAAARAAVGTAPPPASRRPALRRRRWIVPTSVAATVAIAAGLTWQLRPPAMAPAATPAASAAPVAEADGAMTVRMIDRPLVAPPPPPPPLAEAAPARRVASPPTPRVVAEAPSEPAPAALDHFHDEAAGALSAEAASPPAAAAPPVSPPPAPAPTIQAKAAARVREAAAFPRNEAERAADATTLDTVTVDDPGEDVPPATMDSPEAREAWLERIRDLLQAGDIEAAKASLAEFRRRHPGTVLPADLRKLDP